MKKILFCVLLCALAASAADIAGKWTGTVQTGSQNFAVELRLEQKGGQLSGTIGRVGDIERFPLEKARFEESHVAFQITASNGATYKFTGTADGKKMQGELKVEQDGATQNGKMDLTRTGP